MIRSPLGWRLNPDPERSPRDQLREAARLGARGVVLDASGDLAPDRLGETGRRDLRHSLRSMELTLVAMNLPTRRAFDTIEQLDDRLARAERAFALAYELGTRLVLARVGAVPEESDRPRRETFLMAVGELARRADHRGVRLAVESAEQPGAVVRGLLDGLNLPSLAASLDPSTSLRCGHDPVASALALGPWLAHAYAGDAAGPSGSRPGFGNPRGFGFRSGVLDWEEYLGALEEVDYRGYLTIWPDPALDQAAQFQATAEHLRRF
jgi:sugar phosphate isomerase/epimerase